MAFLEGLELEGCELGGVSVEEMPGAVFYLNTNEGLERSVGNYVNRWTDRISGMVLDRVGTKVEATPTSVPMVKMPNGNYLRSGSASSNFKLAWVATGVPFTFWVFLRDATVTAGTNNPVLQLAITASTGGNSSFYVNKNDLSGANIITAGMANIIQVAGANGSFPSVPSILKFRYKRVGSQNQAFLYRHYVTEAGGVKTLHRDLLIGSNSTASAIKNPANFTAEQFQLGGAPTAATFGDMVFMREDTGLAQAEIDKNILEIDNLLIARFLGM
ncbi:hypothetical protein [Rufibacter quisquiliarum]|uniref:Uncharacterized protein n=1 Tax=Rufibacter quisquiliarum TaxID=1549639 RepID=A0A839GI88_9BACT|nr:hypothetical protein [Rufibacter quisquiliarum]MBA9078340.1 hypothetical protein [Rufibacter quisquiliarum]